MVDSISTLGLQLINAANIKAGQSLISTLTQQLATGKKSSSLSEYMASEAQKLVSFTNTITQQESFTGVANSIAPRLNMYDQSMTGIEKTAALAGSVISSSSTYNATQNDALATQFKAYLDQVEYYLNQKVGDRYIFAGSRYGTAPVKKLTDLPTLQIETNATGTIQDGCINFTSKYSGTYGNNIHIALDNGTIPGTYKATVHVAGQTDEVYDNIGGVGLAFWDNLANAINAGSRLITAEAGTDSSSPNLTQTVLVGGTGSDKNHIASTSVSADGMVFSALNMGTYANNISVIIEDGTNTNPPLATTFKATIHIPGEPDEVYDDVDASGGGAAFWTNLEDAINHGQPLAVPATASSQRLMATVGASTTLPTVGAITTYHLSGGTQPQESPPYVTTPNDLPTYDSDYDETYDSLSGLPDPNNRADAFVQDQVAIDTTQNLKYGVTSTQEGFQKLIMGLRFAYAATQDTSPDHANFGTFMDKARDLISTGLSAIRGIHTNVSSASAALQQSQDLQAVNITNLKNQIGDIQNVDINEVAVKINMYQAELEASYAATARMTSLSLLKYL